MNVKAMTDRELIKAKRINELFLSRQDLSETSLSVGVAPDHPAAELIRERNQIRDEMETRKRQPRDER